MTSADTFTCERLHCVLAKRTCADRQRDAIPSQARNSRGDNSKSAALISCRDCAAGRDNVAAIGASPPRSKRLLTARPGPTPSRPRMPILDDAPARSAEAPTPARSATERNRDYRARVRTTRRQRIAAGDAFGRWRILGPGSRKRYFVAQCECGSPAREVFAGSLLRKRGPSRSCGCVSLELTRARLPHLHEAMRARRAAA